MPALVNQVMLALWVAWDMFLELFETDEEENES